MTASRFRAVARKRSRRKLVDGGLEQLTGTLGLARAEVVIGALDPASRCIAAEVDGEVQQFGGGRGGAPRTRGRVGRGIERQQCRRVRAGGGQRQVACPHLGLLDDLGQGAVHLPATGRVRRRCRHRGRAADGQTAPDFLRSATMPLVSGASRSSTTRSALCSVTSASRSTVGAPTLAAASRTVCVSSPNCRVASEPDRPTTQAARRRRGWTVRRSPAPVRARRTGCRRRAR